MCRGAVPEKYKPIIRAALLWAMLCSRRKAVHVTSDSFRLP